MKHHSIFLEVGLYFGLVWQFDLLYTMGTRMVFRCGFAFPLYIQSWHLGGFICEILFFIIVAFSPNIH